MLGINHKLLKLSIHIPDMAQWEDCGWLVLALCLLNDPKKLIWKSYQGRSINSIYTSQSMFLCKDVKAKIINRNNGSCFEPKIYYQNLAGHLIICFQVCKQIAMIWIITGQAKQSLAVYSQLKNGGFSWIYWVVFMSSGGFKSTHIRAFYS